MFACGSSPSGRGSNHTSCHFVRGQIQFARPYSGLGGNHGKRAGCFRYHNAVSLPLRGNLRFNENDAPPSAQNFRAAYQAHVPVFGRCRRSCTTACLIRQSHHNARVDRFPVVACVRVNSQRPDERRVTKDQSDAPVRMASFCPPSGFSHKFQKFLLTKDFTYISIYLCPSRWPSTLPLPL